MKWKNVLLLVVSLLVCLLLLEVIVRVALPTRLLDYRHDTEIGLRYHSDTSYQFISSFGEFDVLNRYNSHGIRGGDVDYDKDDDVFRILGMGDSFTFGYGVEEDETFISLLEGLEVDGRNVEVVNAGLSGYGPQHILRFLQTETIQYNPDLVVVSLFIGNDIVSEGSLYTLEEGELVSHQLDEASFTIKLRQWLAHRSVLYNYLYLIKFRLDVNSGKVNPYAPEVYPFLKKGAELEEGFELTQQILLEIQMYLDSKGVDVVFMVIPLKEQVDSDEMEEFRLVLEEYYEGEVDLDNVDRLHQQLIAFFESEEIEYVDLLPVFKELDEELYFPIDAHLNANGHKAAGIVVAQHLKGIPGSVFI